MRLYTVSSIDEWIVVKAMGKMKAGPKLGKNGGPLCRTSGIISDHIHCVAFKLKKFAEGAVSVSHIRKWKGR